MCCNSKDDVDEPVLLASFPRAACSVAAASACCLLGDVASSRSMACGDARVHRFLINDMNTRRKLRGLITAINGRSRQAIMMKTDN